MNLSHLLNARRAAGKPVRVALIGADGVGSVVRGLIDPTAPRPRYTGLFGIGGRPTSSKGSSGAAPRS